MDFPRVVDAAWLAAHLDDQDLVVGDVRGPNAHTRGHIPGSRPLVLGSPPPGVDDDGLAEIAREIALRLRRHDYVADVVGRWAHAAHFCEEHRESNGLLFPTRRRVLPIAPGGRVLPGPVLVALDLAAIEVETRISESG